MREGQSPALVGFTDFGAAASGSIALIAAATVGLVLTNAHALEGGRAVDREAGAKRSVGASGGGAVHGACL